MSSIYGTNLTALELREQIERGTRIGDIVTVAIGLKAEREAVASLINDDAPRYTIVGFYAKDVQLLRFA